MRKIIYNLFRSFPCGSFLKVPVFIHWSFIYIVLVTVIGSYFTGGTLLALGQLQIILTVYGCVFLHEFGHILMAREYRIETENVTLYMIGGIAKLEALPRGKIEEFKVSIAGPLVNSTIIAITYIVGLIFNYFFHYQPAYFKVLIMVNAWLFFFNMIPAYPMDGGRILRSLLSMKMDFFKATRIAMYVSNVFSVIFIAAAYYMNMPMLYLVAIFIYFGSKAEYKSFLE